VQVRRGRVGGGRHEVGEERLSADAHTWDAFLGCCIQSREWGAAEEAVGSRTRQGFPVLRERHSWALDAALNARQVRPPSPCCTLTCQGGRPDEAHPAGLGAGLFSPLFTLSALAESWRCNGNCQWHTSDSMCPRETSSRLTLCAIRDVAYLPVHLAFEGLELAVALRLRPFRGTTGLRVVARVLQESLPATLTRHMQEAVSSSSSSSSARGFPSRAATGDGQPATKNSGAALDRDSNAEGASTGAEQQEMDSSAASRQGMEAVSEGLQQAAGTPGAPCRQPRAVAPGPGGGGRGQAGQSSRGAMPSTLWGPP